MRVAFAGSHEMSWHCLRAVAELCRDHSDDLVAVFNVPPDRGAKHSAFVDFTALEHEYGFPHHEVHTLSDEPTLELLRSLELDVLFIIGWHRIVPQSVIDAARYCLGFHTSLLPNDRGSSPVNWAIIRGDRSGGVSLFHLTTDVDAGDIVSQASFPIEEHDTCADAHSRSTAAAIDLLHELWPALRASRVPRTPQDLAAGNVNPRRRPDDGVIDWSRDARALHDWVRALTQPYPGAFTTFRGRRLFIWEATYDRAPHDARPGTVVDTGETVDVATSDGVLSATRLQLDGDPECHARVFCRSYGVRPGERLG